MFCFLLSKSVKQTRDRTESFAKIKTLKVLKKSLLISEIFCVQERTQGNVFFIIISLLQFQSHYAQQARRSRSIAKKRKREASAPPTSRTRSQSASRPPRDQSGLRDPKVRRGVFTLYLTN